VGIVAASVADPIAVASAAAGRIAAVAVVVTVNGATGASADVVVTEVATRSPSGMQFFRLGGMLSRGSG
jgi:hypothetical protein